MHFAIRKDKVPTIKGIRKKSLPMHGACEENKHPT
jgi:hypothetical protein